MAQYLTIKHRINEQIDGGLLAANQKLPSERKLAELFSTTRVTLREALTLLEAEGRIYREDRRGWFIAPPPLKLDLSAPIDLLQLATDAQRSAKIELCSAKSVLANKQVTECLGLAPFSDIHQIEQIHYLEQRPVAFVTHYLSVQRCPSLLTFDLAQPLARLYQQQFLLNGTAIEYRIASRSMPGAVAQALRTTQGIPAMMIECIRYDQYGKVIDVEVAYWRHDAIIIESHFAG